jgi:hypothetical protein
MLKKTLVSLVLGSALAFASVAGAQPLTAASVADPSSQQIYDAARAGHLGEAQQMIDQVLRDHPESAKAHYVAAEVYARAGVLARARQELQSAQQLSPGLRFAQASSVASLERELGAGRVQPASHGVSWGAALLVFAIIALVLGLLRRRSAPVNPYAPYGANPYGPVNSPYPGGYPGYGPGYGAPMGGGSGLMGGLATGLALGAGVAAGEALVDHALGAHQGGIISNADAAGFPDPGVNAEMGGSDFGITDGSSWDGGGGGDPFGGGDLGGGGGDWT